MSRRQAKDRDETETEKGRNETENWIGAVWQVTYQRVKETYYTAKLRPPTITDIYLNSTTNSETEGQLFC